MGRFDPGYPHHLPPKRRWRRARFVLGRGLFKSGRGLQMLCRPRWRGPRLVSGRGPVRVRNTAPLCPCSSLAERFGLYLKRAGSVPAKGSNCGRDPNGGRLGFHPGMGQFDPGRPHHLAREVQLGERRGDIAEVVGSTPTPSTMGRHVPRGRAALAAQL